MPTSLHDTFVQNWGDTHSGHRKPGNIRFTGKSKPRVNYIGWSPPLASGCTPSSGGCLWRAGHNLHRHWWISTLPFQLDFYLLLSSGSCSDNFAFLAYPVINLTSVPWLMVFCTSSNTLLLPQSWVIPACSSKFTLNVTLLGSFF